MRSLALLLVPGFLAAQTLSTDTAAKIDTVFSRYTASTPGCAVNTLRNGASIYEKGYGLASIELGAPITPKTVEPPGTIRTADYVGAYTSDELAQTWDVTARGDTLFVHRPRDDEGGTRMRPFFKDAFQRPAQTSSTADSTVP